MPPSEDIRRNKKKASTAAVVPKEPFMKSFNNCLIATKTPIFSINFLAFRLTEDQDSEIEFYLLSRLYYLTGSELPNFEGTYMELGALGVFCCNNSMMEWLKKRG